jgi:hypothetical protein
MSAVSMFSRCVHLIEEGVTLKGSLDAMVYDRWNEARDERSEALRFREAIRKNDDFGEGVVKVSTKLDVWIRPLHGSIVVEVAVRK